MATPYSTLTPIFDPSKQNYMQYLNDMTGFNRPQNSFPAETGQPAPSFAPTTPTAPKPNPVNAAVNANNIYQTANNLIPSATPESSMSIPSASTAATGPESLSATSEWMSGGGGGMGANQTPVTGGMSPMQSPGMMEGVPTALPAAAAVAGTVATNELADKYGVQKPWAALNAMNPMNGLYSLGEDMSSISKGGPISQETEIGMALPTAGLSFAYNPLSKMFGGNPDQGRRRAVRNEAKESGWFDNNFQVPLGDITLDMSKDGKYQYQNSKGEGRPVYNIDWENDPNAAQAVGWIQPLAAVLAKGDEKLTSDFTAQFYNELTKDGGATDLESIRKRVIALYNHTELKPSIVTAALNEMGMDDGRRDAMLAAVDNLRPGKGSQIQPGLDPNRPGQPKQETAAMGNGATAPESKPAPFTVNALGQPQNTPAFTGGAPVRISAGIWQDAKGVYYSKDGVRR